MDIEKEINKYYSVIHWSAVSFISEHDGRNARIFRGELVPSLRQDIVHGLRGLIGNTIKNISDLALSLARRKFNSSPMEKPHIMLITLGTTKYAGEEEQITQACLRNNLDIIKIYPNKGFSIKNNSMTPFKYLLNASNYVDAILNGLKNCLAGMHYIFSADKKARSLFMCVVGSIQSYYLHMMIAKRLIECYGKPKLILSLCPFSPASVAMIEYFKNSHILTAGIRTQSTTFELEHAVINTHVLFAKSHHEKLVYQSLFPNKRPIIEEGCLLSLPAKCSEKLSDLPNNYLLLIGTVKGVEQSIDDYFAYNNALFKYAECFNLPLVFKGHNLAKEIDDLWFANHDEIKNKCYRVKDIRHNHYLIERSSLVISAYSTLIYFIILKEKPLIIFNTSITELNEFKNSPIKQLFYKNTDTDSCSISINKLNYNAIKALSWFQDNYYINNGPDYIVNYWRLKNISQSKQRSADAFLI